MATRKLKMLEPRVKMLEPKVKPLTRSKSKKKKTGVDSVPQVKESGDPG